MARRFLTFVVLVLAVVLLNLAPASAHSSSRRLSGFIVAERYSSENGGNPELVRLRPSDGTASLLTTGNSDRVPDISPDGRYVAFERCVAALDCGEIGKTNIWIMRSDGTEAHPLTHCDGTRCLGAFDPAFSPTGRSIAFAQDRLDSTGTNVQGIFIMRSDATAQRRLTSRREGQPPDGHPDFSPNGKQIVFVREVEGGARLMVIHRDGTGLHELLPGRDAFDPQWSPDGKRIAMTLITHTPKGDAVDVATVRADGSGLRLLTHEPAGVSSAFQPDYSHTGKQIVFRENGPYGCRLVVINATGHHREQLPTGDGCYFNASWEVHSEG